MGRIRVYGEQWDLPEAPVSENPFAKYLKFKAEPKYVPSRIVEDQSPDISPNHVHVWVYGEWCVPGDRRAPYNIEEGTQEL